MAAKTVEGRLLCSSALTYAIRGQKDILEERDQVEFFRGSGWIAPPKVLFGDKDQVNACLFGESQDGWVVAFRGTLPWDPQNIPNLIDWLQAFDAQPIEAIHYPGQVHSGFYQALEPLVEPVMEQLSDAISRRRRSLLLTGHSKGGALASLFAWRVAQRFPDLELQVVTYASAKPANAAFQDTYSRRIDHTRYEYGNDIVPHLPPSQDGLLRVLTSLPLIGERFQDLSRYDYRPLGKLRYVTHSGRIIDDDQSLRAERSLNLASEIIRLRFAQIAAEHSIRCGSGFVEALLGGLPC